MRQSVITTTYLAYYQMTQVKDYKIDISPCHPSQLFILLMEGLRVRISMIIQFVKVYGTLSNLRFIRSVFLSATRKQQRLSIPHLNSRGGHASASAPAVEANVIYMRFHLFKRSEDSV